VSQRARFVDPPRLRTLEDDDGERRATWLELFLDLVFVGAIAQLSAGVGAEAGARDLAILAALFVPVWWAWVGFTFYADRFDTDDGPHRLLVFAGMFAVAALASTIPEAYGGSTAGFAAAYAVTRLVVIALNARAWYHLPAARPLLNVYIPAFTASAVLFAVSILVDPPLRYALWAVALTIDLGTPLLSAERIRAVPIHTSHIPERVGLLTIIVFGETVLAVVIGVDTVTWTWDSGLVAALGFATAAGIWWLYFDFLDTGVVQRSILAGQVYLFSHLPLLIGLTGLGVGVKLAIKASGDSGVPAGAAWSMAGGVALVLAAMAVIHLVTVPTGFDSDVGVRLVAAVVALGIAAFASGLWPVTFTALVAALITCLLVVELVGHEAHAGSDLELVGDEVEREGPSIPMDSHAHPAANQVADH
jgi:low temperature requirement protein LtrA